MEGKSGRHARYYPCRGGIACRGDYGGDQRHDGPITDDQDEGTSARLHLEEQVVGGDQGGMGQIKTETGSSLLSGVPDHAPGKIAVARGQPGGSAALQAVHLLLEAVQARPG